MTITSTYEIQSWCKKSEKKNELFTNVYTSVVTDNCTHENDIISRQKFNESNLKIENCTNTWQLKVSPRVIMAIESFIKCYCNESLVLARYSLSFLLPGQLTIYSHFNWIKDFSDDFLPILTFPKSR